LIVVLIVPGPDVRYLAVRPARVIENFRGGSGRPFLLAKLKRALISVVLLAKRHPS
jgi:hypothetical protein